MEAWHGIDAVRQDTGRRQVAVTGMEGASVSSGRERAGHSEHDGGCRVSADKTNRSIGRCTPFNIREGLASGDASASFLHTENFAVFASLAPFPPRLCGLTGEEGKRVSI